MDIGYWEQPVGFDLQAVFLPVDEVAGEAGENDEEDGVGDNGRKGYRLRVTGRECQTALPF